MGFRFRYESLRSYRQHMKEKAELDLAVAQRRLRQCRELSNSYRESLIKAKNDLGTDLKAGMPAHMLKNYSDYISDLNIRIELQKTEIMNAEAVVKEKMRTLRAKIKEYEILVRLKEKDLKKWNYEQQQAELKLINETAVLRFGKDYI